MLFSVSAEESEIDLFFSLSGNIGAVFLLKGKERANVFLLESGND